jgi:glycosyltransferase involved in cell wall biosynthesis
LEKVILERVDYVLCNSRFTLANVLKSSKPKKTKVIPPGVDVHKFQPYSEEIVDEHLVSKIPTDYPIIFTVGRLIELKGHKYLIEAFRSLTEDPLPRLVIGGDGPLRNELELCVKEYNLSDRVTFLGHVPTHLTPFYYSMADIYVQPSIIDNDGNTEGLGVTLVEAMACETPCIGSDVGGIPDIIVDGQNGLLVTPADPVQLANKISILLKNNDLRLQMGKQARDFVKENYSWQAKAEELAEIYSCLINNNNLQNKTPPS